jgi:small-conductance mechanosensitive channel/regulator of replication initiation timing
MLIRKVRPFLLVMAAAIFSSPLASPDNSPAPGAINQADLLRHLNAVISLYKNSVSRVQPGQQPSDIIFLNNSESLVAEVVRLAFQSARAQISFAEKSATAGTENPESQDATITTQQHYVKLESDLSLQIAQEQSQNEALKRQITGNANANKALLANQQSLEGKLALDKATLDAVQKMKSFVENSNSGGTGLEGSINELARSVPEAFGSLANAKSNAAVPAKAQVAESPGLVGQLMILYGQMQSIRSIDQLINENASVRSIASDMRQPLRNQLSATLQKGKEPAPGTLMTKEQYDALTQSFNQLSAALLPLSQEIVVLDQDRSNLLEWKRSLTSESEATLRALILRVGSVFLALAVVMGLAEIWRRLTFRYIHDPRRRRQFLVLRRFVMGFLISLVVVMGFISEFSSLATFAGFVTAGIAVGLQTVLLSVAAYFFVIGRYGIRVGDRITVAGVTGDVIDVGLVRFYLLEVAGTGIDLNSTGRIVVFSNSVLFQPTTPLYKQVPGTNYLWHEVALPLAQGTDYGLLQKTLLAAIESALKQVGGVNKHQASAWEESSDIYIPPPAPDCKLQFADTGLELIARYPVALGAASEVDGKLTVELLEAIKGDPKLSSGIMGSPRIRAAVKG